MTDVNPRLPGGTADWDRIRARLAALGEMDETSSGLSADQARVVLEGRARILSIPPGSDRSGEDLELVQLELADETYAIESRFVYEAFRSAGMALLPGAEPPVVGITAWRGELLTLLDLRQIMGLPAASVSKHGQVLVLGTHTPAFGVLVDEVRDILKLPVSSLTPKKEQDGEESRYLAATTTDAVLLIAAADLIQSYS